MSFHDLWNLRIKLGNDKLIEMPTLKLSSTLLLTLNKLRSGPTSKACILLFSSNYRNVNMPIGSCKIGDNQAARY